MKQQTIIQIANYHNQLAYLEKEYWFERLPIQEYIVRFDAIKKRISELEQDND
jgi:hypothetical protein